MAFRVKSINADSCFLLSFQTSNCDDPDSSFNVLLDPWLAGPSTFLNERFAHTFHTAKACINSLLDLPRIDLIVVSQDMPDHCHKPTLCQLPRETPARIVAPPAAARRILGWRHFKPDRIHTLRRYDSDAEDCVARFRMSLPGHPDYGGEIKISYIAPKRDLKGLHNAIGITYRPCGSIQARNPRVHYIDLPHAPPAQPNKVLRTTLHPSPLDPLRGKTMSILYSPHGVKYGLVRAYASSHLVQEAALPLDVLLHSRHRVSNAWYLGGTICTGSPGGAAIARNLGARHWISAHDEEKLVSGISTRTLNVEKFGDEKLAFLLQSHDRHPTQSVPSRLLLTQTVLHSLDAGEDVEILPR